MATYEEYLRRINKRGQSSGEYAIYLDGKFQFMSDNSREADEDIEELATALAKEDEKKEKESSN